MAQWHGRKQPKTEQVWRAKRGLRHTSRLLQSMAGLHAWLINNKWRRTARCRRACQQKRGSANGARLLQKNRGYPLALSCRWDVAIRCSWLRPQSPPSRCCRWLAA
jgi:hypothetical protein